MGGGGRGAPSTRDGDDGGVQGGGGRVLEEHGQAGRRPPVHSTRLDPARGSTSSPRPFDKLRVSGSSQSARPEPVEGRAVATRNASMWDGVSSRCSRAP